MQGHAQLSQSGAWPGASLLALRGAPADGLRSLLTAARDLVREGDRRDPHRPTLVRATIATAFFESSTRTRVSFTIAAQRLGAAVVDLGPASSTSKGETLIDTCRTIEAMGVDALIVRHEQAGAAQSVERALRASGSSCAVLNAGDGRHEHPTQGLLDALTIAEAHGRLDSFDLSGLRIAVVGDAANSRVARSDVAAFTTLGAEVVIVGPPNLAPRSLEALGCRVEEDLDAVLSEVDAVQMLRIQFERAASVASPADHAAGYQLSAARAATLRPGAVVLHPGPMNRGLEVAPEVADGPRSRVLRQVRMGVFVRMACLEACVGAAQRSG